MMFNGRNSVLRLTTVAALTVFIIIDGSACHGAPYDDLITRVTINDLERRSKLSGRSFEELLREENRPELTPSKKREILRAKTAVDATRAADQKRQNEFCASKVKTDIGMSQQDVVAGEWGRPETVRTRQTDQGTSEVWVYNRGPLCQNSKPFPLVNSSSYLVFRNGRLASIDY